MGLKGLTIAWMIIGIFYLIIYAINIHLNQWDLKVFGAGLVAILSFMTASIIQVIPKREKDSIKED